MSLKMHRVEFIALIATMFATIAFSIDAMLPALPEIGLELSPEDPTRSSLILMSFVLGLGVGTFFTGPLSDAFGRKPVILWGSALYIIASAVAWRSGSLEVVLAARVVQGLGGAAPRIVALAIMRDLFAGREMARMVSLAMTVFTLFPAVAPLVGSWIIDASGWRAIFLAFVVFSCLTCIWMALRLPESLPPENRRPFRLRLLVDAIRQMLAHPTVRLSIVVQSLSMALLFTLLTMVHPIYELIYDELDSFPYWFAVIAIVAASASILNAAIVVRVGMRRVVTWTLGGQIIVSGLMIGLEFVPLPRDVAFGIFIGYQFSAFFMAGLLMGNLNAIAMEPMGHIAGMAASTIGGISTVSAAVVAALIGLMFDGTLWPLILSLFGLSTLGYMGMLQMGHVERRLAS